MASSATLGPTRPARCAATGTSSRRGERARARATATTSGAPARGRRADGDGSSSARSTWRTRRRRRPADAADALAALASAPRPRRPAPRRASSARASSSSSSSSSSPSPPSGPADEDDADWITRNSDAVRAGPLFVGAAAAVSLLTNRVLQRRRARRGRELVAVEGGRPVPRDDRVLGVDWSHVGRVEAEAADDGGLTRRRRRRVRRRRRRRRRGERGAEVDVGRAARVHDVRRDGGVLRGEARRAVWDGAEARRGGRRRRGDRTTLRSGRSASGACAPGRGTTSRT